MSETGRTTNDGVAFEPSDVAPRLVAFIAAGIVAVVALSIVAIRLAYPTTLHGPSDAPRRTPAAPRLQIDPLAELGAYRAAEDDALATYGWIDQGRGVVRIPIDQAMRDVAAAGIADWPGGAR